jgi:hypothetical protein
MICAGSTNKRSTLMPLINKDQRRSDQRKSGKSALISVPISSLTSFVLETGNTLM